MVGSPFVVAVLRASEVDQIMQATQVLDKHTNLPYTHNIHNHKPNNNTIKLINNDNIYVYDYVYVYIHTYIKRDRQ